jgi:hypothetical protein
MAKARLRLVTSTKTVLFGQVSGDEIVRNPSLKSDRDCCRRLTALQGEVAVADQTAHLVLADPHRQAPQPDAPPPAVCLQPLGSRRLETRYIRWVIFRQRVSAGSYGVPHLQSSGPWLALTKGRAVDRQDLALITATDAVRRSDPLTITKDSALEPASVAAATSSAAQGAALDQMKRDRGADDTGSKHDNVTARQENLCCDMDAMMPLRSRWQGFVIGLLEHDHATASDAFEAALSLSPSSAFSYRLGSVIAGRTKGTEI